jgi:uncharacterized protein YecE (DUF72 family)
VQKRLGPVLFQLPPNLTLDAEKLERFLDAAPDDVPLAFEFRNKTWFTDPVYDALKRRGAALCLAESEKLTVPHAVTADFVYFRLRKDKYSPEDLSEIRGTVNGLGAEGKDIYVFFKHDETPDGALYAEKLLHF